MIGEHIIINYTIGLVKNFIKNFFYKKAQNKRIISVHRVNEKDRCLVEIRKEQIRRSHEIGVIRKKEALARQLGAYICDVANRGLSISSGFVKDYETSMRSRYNRDISIAEEALERYIACLDVGLELRSEQRLGSVLPAENERDTELQNAELNTLFNLACLIPTGIGRNEDSGKP